MTLSAVLRKVRGHVIGIGRALEILQVTTDAGGTGQVIVVVDVAIGTLPRGHCMGAGKCESRTAVIKRGV